MYKFITRGSTHIKKNSTSKWNEWVFICVCVCLWILKPVYCAYMSVYHDIFLQSSLSLYLIFASIFVLFSFHILLFFLLTKLYYLKNHSSTLKFLCVFDSFIGPIHSYVWRCSFRLIDSYFISIQFRRKRKQEKNEQAKKKLTTMKSAICVCWILF